MCQLGYSNKSTRSTYDERRRVIATEEVVTVVREPAMVQIPAFIVDMLDGTSLGGADIRIVLPELNDLLEVFVVASYTVVAAHCVVDWFGGM